MILYMQFAKKTYLRYMSCLNTLTFIGFHLQKFYEQISKKLMKSEKTKAPFIQKRCLLEVLLAIILLYFSHTGDKEGNHFIV